MPKGTLFTFATVTEYDSTMSSDPGRNDPCPCGSGKKYKYCCMRSSGWLSSTTQARLLTVLTLAIGLTIAGLSLSQCGEDSSRCPPGQVWSDAHGHCH